MSVPRADHTISSPPLRVLFVNENIGGNATMHLHLRRALQSNHPEVAADFLDVPRRGPVRRLAGAAIPGLARLDLDLAPLRGQLALSAHVRRRVSRCAGTYDTAHVYTHNAALLSVSWLRRTPAVVGLDATSAQSLRLLPYRSPTRFTDLAARPGRSLERRVYSAAAAIVAKSEWARRSLIDDYAIPAARITVIPYGIEVPEQSSPTRNGEVIAFVGRSMERKGGWLLLEAWRRRLRDRARLVLVTPERVPPEHGLTVINDVRPGDGRLRRVLTSASVLAFPSQGDTFGYAALEAMAVATPVVAARAAAMPEIIDEGHSGLLVEPGDSEALAVGLERMLDDAAQREEMGRAARQTVLERFDAKATTAKVVALLHEVAAS